MEDNNWTQTTNEEQLFEFEHDDYAGFLVRGKDLESSDVNQRWDINAYYQSDHLVNIERNLDGRKDAIGRATDWMSDHPGFAGIRVNDGVNEGPHSRTYTEWTEGQQETAIEHVRKCGYEEGAYIHHAEKGGYYQITELSMNGFAAVGVENQPNEVYDVYSTYPANVARLIDDQSIEKITKHVVENPLGILHRFAEVEITENIETLGMRHDFNEIEGVESIMDLQAALQFGRTSKRE